LFRNAAAQHVVTKQLENALTVWARFIRVD
jgi:hypothetical protein